MILLNFKTFLLQKNVISRMDIKSESEIHGNNSFDMQTRRKFDGCLQHAIKIHCIFWSNRRYRLYRYLPKDGIFQLLLWRLRDMNNFEFWRQFSAFVELIFGHEGCVMILQYFRLNFFLFVIDKTKQNSWWDQSDTQPMKKSTKIQNCSYHEVCIEEVKKCHV